VRKAETLGIRSTAVLEERPLSGGSELGTMVQRDSSDERWPRVECGFFGTGGRCAPSHEIRASSGWSGYGPGLVSIRSDLGRDRCGPCGLFGGRAPGMIAENDSSEWFEVT
jgi:hypothetical protein